MKKWKEKISIFVIALLLAIVGFVALLWVERQSLKEFDKQAVVRCIKLCPAGEKITVANVYDYFELEDIPVGLVTEQTFDSLDALVDFYPGRTVMPGEIVYASVLKTEDYAEVFLEPVEISITVDVEDAVAGRIRKGDTVNVYVRNVVTNEFELIMEKVVVLNAYDANANMISMGDERSLASIFTFCVESSIAEDLGYLFNGDLVVLKVRK